MPCAIIRDESVFESDSVVRVEYVAKENTEIAQGDTIANLYTTGYSESLLTKLETTRQNIQAYHKTLLGTIVDNDLDRLDTIIDMVAMDFREPGDAADARQSSDRARTAGNRDGQSPRNTSARTSATIRS